MDTLFGIVKGVYKMLFWTLKNLFWMPLKFLTLTSFKVWKNRKKDDGPGITAISSDHVQRVATSHLPELTAQKEKLDEEMKKLSDKWNKLNAEKRAIEDMISIAGGSIGKARTRNNNRNNNQNNNKQNNNKQNQQQSKELTIGDADFKT